MRIETLPDGEPIPVLGLGTWGYGGGMSADSSRDEAQVALLIDAIQMGYTHIDTAEFYGRGHTEELVGQASRSFPRGDLFLTTKVWHTNLRYPDVHAALEGSLARLKTNYVDLYLIHWPNDRVPLAETFRALNELVESGKVRYLGVSNFSLRQLQAAQELSATPLATNQIPYSLTNRRHAGQAMIEYCRENRILVTAYSPIKGGPLRHPVVRSLADSRGTPAAQIALHWLIRQPGVITIPKSADRQRLRENLGAVDLALTDEEIQRLDAIH
jgi:diketogulonate reductase-like aldo/keto reductase